jgi:hypothetical protein
MFMALQVQYRVELTANEQIGIEGKRAEVDVALGAMSHALDR